MIALVDTISSILYKLVNDSLIAGLAVNNPPQKEPHGIPIWIATDGVHLFFYSQKNSKKIKLLRENFHCTIIFLYGFVKGTCTLINKTETRFQHYFKVFDPRYAVEDDYKMYKSLWDVLVLIEPKRIKTFY